MIRSATWRCAGSGAATQAGLVLVTTASGEPNASDL
jgi:hypothetical protein